MHTETVTGLLSVKPGNEPKVGETRTFVIEHRTSLKGKPYIKIKGAGPDYGGERYKILSAERTDYQDAHGNLSFNVEIEKAEEAPRQTAGTPETNHVAKKTDAHLADGGVNETRRHLMQSANLYCLVLDAVEKVIEVHAKKTWPEGLGGEMFRTTVSTLFIEASHKRTDNGVDWWSYVNKMPDKPIK